MANPLDMTLEALQNIQDAIDEIKVRRNITSEKQTLEDYDKIITHLEGSMSDMINAVVIFQKYDKAL
jgi:imidazoleglycerol phosphate synthase glutamine amidotransferase subunit HisH